MFIASRKCPICRAGPVGFFRLSNSETVVLLCDECYSVWTSLPLKEEDALYPADPDYEVGGTSSALIGGHAGWATRADLVRCGWEVAITDETDVTNIPDRTWTEH
jgi:hypothetical protein